ncbi:Fc receptor-like protein 1 isoform X7 [Meriones unguiculatus]|uniref:Fc receptor-like protein 1 isoform X7 n=1 Tax=Meriones unguiculatus TaxID=10047 RepID=UPI00293F748B|nr:Fc receptor-like protein 1 isoform X7 [Meriones unguiculatus]
MVLMLPWLLLLLCAVPCEAAVLSPHPVLEASPSKPVEGRSVTLTCKIDLPAQRQSVQFCFSCNDNFLGSGCSRSPKLQIPALWRKWPDYYQCIAVTTSLTTNRWSLPIRIPVQRIPVSDVSLKTRPPGGRVMEGNRLVLICSVANATGNITYLWYRGARGSNLGTKTQHSLTAEFEIAEVNRSDAQQYYCAADNGYGPVPSELFQCLAPCSRLGAPEAGLRRGTWWSCAARPREALPPSSTASTTRPWLWGTLRPPPGEGHRSTSPCARSTPEPSPARPAMARAPSAAPPCLST